MADIFISYSRDDSDFVRKLVDTLEIDGRDVWVDFNDIPFGTKWWDEIEEAIETTPAGIFVISPSSIESEYCSLEIRHLFLNHKKIVPIVAVKPDDESIEKLPQTVRDLNWVFFDHDDFDNAFRNLLEAVDTDIEASKAHTKLLINALEWQRRGHNKDNLLRGDELADFLPMLESGNLIAVQEAYLELSLSAAQARYNFWRFIFGFLGSFLAMGYYALATWRGGISPVAIVIALGIGEIFGFFTGLIAVFGSALPEFIKKRVSPAIYNPVRIIVCVLAGMFAWIVYQWLFLNLGLLPTWAAFLGGVAMSAGFIVNTLLKPPSYITFLLTGVLFYVAIFFLNPVNGIMSDIGLVEPLIYFDRIEQVYFVGAIMAVLYATGTNAHILWQTFFGGNRVTQFLEGRSIKQKHKNTPANA